MNDIKCIKDDNLIIENDYDLEYILKNNGFQVILCLYSCPKTIKEISEETKISSLNVKLIISRLQKKGIVKVSNIVALNGNIQKKFELVEKNVEVLCNSKNENMDLYATSQYFCNSISKIIKNFYIDKPNKAKISYIKASSQNIEKFNKELEELYKKYDSMDDEDESEIYGFICVLGLYT